MELGLLEHEPEVLTTNSGAASRALRPASKPGLVLILGAVVVIKAGASEVKTVMVCNWQKELQGTYATGLTHADETRNPDEGTLQYSTLTTGKVLLPRK